ncbi:hypothetical protein Q664_27400 [Archangium violaceum Cb vi76]|uniref:Uncharacterized protein n=1 Tax=Archangium violaceum Cb vi76 TaxID=1406225 RepID=A0A084SQ58_9BACT|nr:hypothetical protein Q664_27400 [Archangium violaceum Cb vi76]
MRPGAWRVGEGLFPLQDATGPKRQDPSGAVAPGIMRLSTLPPRDFPLNAAARLAALVPALASAPRDEDTQQKETP